MMKTRWRGIFFHALEVDTSFVPDVIVAYTMLHNIQYVWAMRMRRTLMSPQGKSKSLRQSVVVPYAATLQMRRNA